VVGVTEAAVATQTVAGAQPASPKFKLGRWFEGWPGYAVMAFVAVLLGLSALDEPAAQLYHGGALVILLVGLVATKAVPDHVAALIFFLVAVGITAIPPKIAFSGFYTGASWLILSGSIIAAALTESGLSARIAHTIFGRVGNNYAAVIASIAVVCVSLTFLLPSTAARILLLVPIILSLADRLGYGPQSRGRVGMVIATLCLSALPCISVLTSGNRTMVVAGLAETLYGLKLRYSDFLIWNFPVLTFLLVLLISVLVIWRYGEPPVVAEQTSDAALIQDPLQKFVLRISLCTLALWMTDFLHHVSPAWVGLAAVVAFLVGPTRNLALFEKARFDYWLMFVAFISMGGVITETGLGARMGEVLVSLAGLEVGDSITNKLYNLAAISLISIGINLSATSLAGSVVLLTLADSIAAASGFSVKSTLVLMMPSFAITPIAFQMPILLIGMRLAGLPLKELNVSLLIITGITIIFLLPLHFLWLWSLGLIDSRINSPNKPVTVERQLLPPKPIAVKSLQAPAKLAAPALFSPSVADVTGKRLASIEPAASKAAVSPPPSKIAASSTQRLGTPSQIISRTETIAAKSKTPPQISLAVEPPNKEVKASSSAYRIQIASMRSAGAAKKAWEQLTKGHADLFGKLQPKIVRTEIAKKGLFFRLQAGPLADAKAARAICKRVKKRKIECLIVRP
jgi:di/tricarboxylate transporter